MNGIVSQSKWPQNSFVWEDSYGNIKRMHVPGHWLLVRKCSRNEGDFYAIAPESVEAPEPVPGMNWADADMAVKNLCENMDHFGIVGHRPGATTNWCEVLAVGPEVGKQRSHTQMDSKFKKHPKQRRYGSKYHIPWGTNVSVKVGDRVILPESARFDGMYRGVTGSPHDVLVEEHAILMSIPAEKVA